MTLLDILNTIPDLKVRFWAVENCKSRKGARLVHVQDLTISTAIQQAFIWNNCTYPKGVSNEGRRDFWENQHQRFKQLESIQLLEINEVINHFTPVD